VDRNLVCSHSDGGVFFITLNRPDRLNAINDDLVVALLEALKAANRDAAVRVIVFGGAGRAFCAGADLEDPGLQGEPDEAKVRADTERLQEVTRQLLFSDRVVIGAIQGWAVGAGLEWAINCDFPIWAVGARGFFPEAKWGLSVTGAVTALLPALVGPIKARELLLLGEKHSAREFLELGIAWKVVSNDTLQEEAVALAQRLAQLSPRTLRDLKRGVLLGANVDIERALAYETEANVAAVLDLATMESIKGFSAS